MAVPVFARPLRRALLWLALPLAVSCAKTPIEMRLGPFPEAERAFLEQILTAPALDSLGFTLIAGGGPAEDSDGGPGDSGKSDRVNLRRAFRWSDWKQSTLMYYDNSPAASGPASGSGVDSVSGSSPVSGSSTGGIFVPLSRVCMVPRAEVWEGKTSLDREAAYRSDPVPLTELMPPHVALKVDGLDVSDPAYPLVRLGGIVFETPGGFRGGTKKRTEALARYIQQCLEERRSAGGNTGNAGTGGPLPPWEQPPRLFRIAAGGDAMLARGVEGILFTEGAEAVFGGTAALVREADLAILNLEGAVTGRGEAAQKTYTFRFDPRCAAVLKDMGFDAALLANNHAFDYGLPGFLDSLRYLEAAGIAPLGAGRNIVEAAAPYAAGGENGGGGGGPPVRVFGIASFGPERNGWDGAAYAAGDGTPGMLHRARSGPAELAARFAPEGLDLVFFHGGTEYADSPDAGTRKLYTELIAAGADLVIGTHPHVEQGFEWVLGKPVFWSLGDYVFDEMDDTPGGDKGIFIVLSYAGETLVYVEPRPVFMNGPRTVIAPPEQLERFFRLSRTLADK